ncbi:MAG: response regulator [Planctomycetota bacterium]|jgi:diguanylate cyclase (GGDEF)-like protein|nr:response regulator [Planctomycetota bacterium]
MPDKVNILLVDDSAVNLELLEAMLTGPDLELKKAHSGEDALQLLKENEFALILLDVQMPGIDGYETAGRIRKNPAHSHVPIIFVTASKTGQEWINKGYKSGAVDYLSKPLESEILNRKVEVFVDLFREKQELKNLSVHDEVTGLYTRREFFVLAQQQLDYAKRARKGFILIVAEVAGFQFIVDNCGIEDSQTALSDVGNVIRDTFRSSDISSRIGSDVCAILALEAFGASTTDILTMRLKENLAAFNNESGRNYQLQFNLGTVTFDPTSPVSIEELLAEAEYMVSVEKANRRGFGDGG